MQYHLNWDFSNAQNDGHIRRRSNGIAPAQVSPGLEIYSQFGKYLTNFQRDYCENTEFSSCHMAFSERTPVFQCNAVRFDGSISVRILQWLAHLYIRCRLDATQLGWAPVREDAPLRTTPNMLHSAPNTSTQWIVEHRYVAMDRAVHFGWYSEIAVATPPPTLPSGLAIWRICFATNPIAEWIRNIRVISTVCPLFVCSRYAERLCAECDAHFSADKVSTTDPILYENFENIYLELPWRESPLAKHTHTHTQWIWSV